jgi:solute carrier family 36 (proton-coupled amino acid transporter)
MQLISKLISKKASKVHYKMLVNRSVVDSKIEKKGLTNIRTFYSLLKSIVGTGILYQPQSFYYGGVLFSSIASVSIGMLTLTCMIWLSKAQSKYSGKLSYPDIAGLAIGKIGVYLVDFMIFATQAGPSALNVGFVIDNSLTSLSDLGLDVNAYIVMLFVLLLLIPLCLIKTIRDQSLAHIVADVFIISNILIIGFYSSSTGLSTKDVDLVNPNKMIYALGTFVYGFEGVALLFPIKNEMLKPESFESILSVLFMIICSLFIWFGNINVFSYNSDIEDLVTSNLPDTVWVSIMLLFYVVGIILTLPLALYPTFLIVEKYLRLKGVYVEISRCALVCIVVILGTAARKSLGVCVSIIGGMFCSPVAFIFPAIINLKLNSETQKQQIVSWAMILTGVAFGIITTFNAIYYL